MAVWCSGASIGAWYDPQRFLLPCLFRMAKVDIDCLTKRAHPASSKQALRWNEWPFASRWSAKNGWHSPCGLHLDQSMARLPSHDRNCRLESWQYSGRAESDAHLVHPCQTASPALPTCIFVLPSVSLSHAQPDSPVAFPVGTDPRHPSFLGSHPQSRRLDL